MWRSPRVNLPRDYGQGVVELEGTELEEGHLAEELIGVVRETFKSSSYAPPVLPAAAIELHQMSLQSDVQLSEIVSVLEKDPLLAARVVKVASSPLYGGRAVQSLQDAVVRLGLQNVREVVWQVALNMRVFRSKAYQAPMELVRRHSVAVAHLSRAIGKLTPVPLDYAFLCGLLHDVGAAAVLLLLEAGEGRERPLTREVLDLVLGACHAEASAVLAGVWTLPADVALVLRHHHDADIEGHTHPTAAIIALAERVLFQLEAESVPGWVPGWDESSHRAWMIAQRALGLPEQALSAIEKECSKILERLGEST